MDVKKRVNVLDHGFVELVDYMGSDQRVVDAARVSVSGDEVKPVSTNEGLIRYLMRHKHSTPSEMPQFTFAIKMPILTMRQLVRHRTASINEMSARYSVLPDQFYIPDLERLNVQAKNNHQGSDPEVIAEARTVQEKLKAHAKLSYELYMDLLDTGLARELARNVLPVSIYTQIYWTIDLRNLFHFLALRRDGHAQYEIRVFAEAIWEIIQPLFPYSCKAWEDYVFYSADFSRIELRILHKMLSEVKGDTHLRDLVWNDTTHELSGREKREFLNKLGLGDER